MLKRFLKSDGVRAVLCWLGALYIRLVHATGRWRVVGGDVARARWVKGEPFILCFWHGRLLMMPYCWPRDRAIHMLISEHRDGQIIARTVGHIGIRTVTGSSSKGGAQALRAMVRALKDGDCVGITPDGPRGPRMRASDGIVSLAQLAGVPIIPATFGVTNGRLVNSWDRFLLAWPFGRGVIVWGDPIEVPRDADTAGLEAARAAVEAALNAITTEADRLTGRVPVEPADVPAAAALQKGGR
ncbi:MAG: lysophospholipid acyltransferase family protein [Rhodospirillaceae bacterium]